MVLIMALGVSTGHAGGANTVGFGVLTAMIDALGGSRRYLWACWML